MTWIRRIIDILRANSSLTIIITAAILLECISIGQHIYTRSLLSVELEKRAESELTTKAMVVKYSLDVSAIMMNGHVWDVKNNLANPDSLYNVEEHVLRSHRNIQGCCIAFTPYYYPKKGELFEPYVYFKDGKIVKEQIAGPSHDYTKGLFYNLAKDQETSGWTDPYYDEINKQIVVTNAMAVRDDNGRFIAAFGLDLSINWLSDTLNTVHDYPSSYNLLLTETGKVIAGPRDTIAKWKDVERVVAMINDSNVAKRSTESGGSKVFKFESFNGDDGYVFISGFEGSPQWQVAMVCYDDEVYGKLNHSRLLFSLLNIVALVALAMMVLGFAGSNRRLHRIRMEQERINSELHVANNIQMQMLPEKYPPFPQRNDLDIYGALVPAREVGGDIFDFFLRDEKLFFCIGDVSGKGVPSAMVMSVTRTLFRSASAHENNPSRIMQTINETLCEGNKSNMFVTLFIGALDLLSGRLRYCNAGHDYPILVGDDIVDLPVMSNMPVGAFSDLRYMVQETEIAPMTTIFLYTDGLTEAKNMQRDQFTLKRVKDVLGEHKQDTTQTILESMGQAVVQFVEGAEQSDDLTMLAIRYQPKPEEDVLREKLELTNNVRQVPELNNFVKSVSARVGIEGSPADKIRLAVEEAVVNIMSYAYPRETKGDITVEARSDGKVLRFIITDRGVAFDPTEALRADTTLSIEDRPIGGLGILLVREMMDTINYERVKGKNILTLIKNIKH